MRQVLACAAAKAEVAEINGHSLPKENAIPSSETSEKPSEAVVIDIGSGVAVCDVPYDYSKYDRLVEEFRK